LVAGPNKDSNVADRMKKVFALKPDYCKPDPPANCSTRGATTRPRDFQVMTFDDMYLAYEKEDKSSDAFNKIVLKSESAENATYDTYFQADVEQFGQLTRYKLLAKEKAGAVEDDMVGKNWTDTRTVYSPEAATPNGTLFLCGQQCQTNATYFYQGAPNPFKPSFKKNRVNSGFIIESYPRNNCRTDTYTIKSVMTSRYLTVVPGTVDAEPKVGFSTTLEDLPVDGKKNFKPTEKYLFKIINRETEQPSEQPSLSSDPTSVPSEQPSSVPSEQPSKEPTVVLVAPVPEAPTPTVQAPTPADALTKDDTVSLVNCKNDKSFLYKGKKTCKQIKKQIKKSKNRKKKRKKICKKDGVSFSCPVTCKQCP